MPSPPPDPPLSQEIVDGVCRRDPDAVAEAFRTLSGPVYGYLLRRTKDPSWSQDLVGEVFCEVMDAAGGFEGDPVGFRAWVFRIARNTMFDHFRRESRRQHASIEDLQEAGRMPPAADDPASEALAEVEQDRILQLVDDLSPDQRDVVLLRLVADLPVAEVAALVDKTPGAVKALQHRALRTLANRLGPEAEEGDHHA